LAGVENIVTSTYYFDAGGIDERCRKRIETNSRTIGKICDQHEIQCKEKQKQRTETNWRRGWRADEVWTMCEEDIYIVGCRSKQSDISHITFQMK